MSQIPMPEQQPSDDWFYEYLENWVNSRCIDPTLEPEPPGGKLIARPVALEMILWGSSGFILMLGVHLILNKGHN